MTRILKALLWQFPQPPKPITVAWWIARVTDRPLTDRALLRSAPIVILDEPTSALDVATEEAVWSNVEQLMAGRTAIVIAHRLSTVQYVDEILVMHKGRIRERGTHQELLARRGMYWKLYELQYKDQERGAGPLVPASGDGA